MNEPIYIFSYIGKYTERSNVFSVFEREESIRVYENLCIPIEGYIVRRGEENHIPKTLLETIELLKTYQQKSHQNISFFFGEKLKEKDLETIRTLVKVNAHIFGTMKATPTKTDLEKITWEILEQVKYDYTITFMPLRIEERDFLKQRLNIPK